MPRGCPLEASVLTGPLRKKHQSDPAIPPTFSISFDSVLHESPTKLNTTHSHFNSTVSRILPSVLYKSLATSSPRTQLYKYIRRTVLYKPLYPNFTARMVQSYVVFISLVIKIFYLPYLSAVLGFPRMGVDRDLKKATEAYWGGKLSQKDLLAEGKRLRLAHWKIQKEAGIDVIPSNDFSYYDHVLDHIQLFGVSTTWKLSVGLSYLLTLSGHPGEILQVQARPYR